VIIRRPDNSPRFNNTPQASVNSVVLARGKLSHFDNESGLAVVVLDSLCFFSNPPTAQRVIAPKPTPGKAKRKSEVSANAPKVSPVKKTKADPPPFSRSEASGSGSSSKSANI
jgi:hypothetical protein